MNEFLDAAQENCDYQPFKEQQFFQFIENDFNQALQLKEI